MLKSSIRTKKRSTHPLITPIDISIALKIYLFCLYEQYKYKYRRGAGMYAQAGQTVPPEIIITMIIIIIVRP